jgi:hypothetical protein
MGLADDERFLPREMSLSIRRDTNLSCSKSSLLMLPMQREANLKKPPRLGNA